MTANIQKNKYQAYAAATQTVAKTQQIIMLYDGVIRLVQQAKDAIANKRIEDRYHLLAKAGEIVHGLQGCLDFDAGKEIANVLFSFYSTIDSKIFSIQRTNDIALCDEVIADLKQMREAWQAVDEQVLTESAAASPTAVAIPVEPAAASAQPTSAPNMPLVTLSA